MGQRVAANWCNSALAARPTSTVTAVTDIEEIA
jgi:hypothetical protein